jgi:hypothetical protein
MGSPSAGGGQRADGREGALVIAHLRTSVASFLFGLQKLVFTLEFSADL